MEKVIIRKLSLDEIENLGIRNWPVWEKEVSCFNHFYTETEECYFLEGEVTIETEANQYQLKPGDFVTFMENLSCSWNIKSPVKKHYNFP